MNFFNFAKSSAQISLAATVTLGGNFLPLATAIVHADSAPVSTMVDNSQKATGEHPGTNSDNSEKACGPNRSPNSETVGTGQQEKQCQDQHQEMGQGQSSNTSTQQGQAIDRSGNSHSDSSGIGFGGKAVSGPSSANSGSNSAATGGSTGPVNSTGTSGVNYAPVDRSVSKTNVFAPNQAGSVLPGSDRYVLRDDCGDIESDLTVSSIVKNRKLAFGILNFGISGDLSSSSFTPQQRAIQEQVLASLHGSLMRAAERSSSYVFARSSIMMSLASAQRSGLEIDVKATMAELDAKFRNDDFAWAAARNESITLKKVTCSSITMTAPPTEAPKPPTVTTVFTPVAPPVTVERHF